MEFTLNDYQVDAVADVLTNLSDARDFWHRRGRRSAVSLSATTGAGKTVMATAVIEALFRGDDTFDFEADPSAVILWFSDDPSLNEQTRSRILEASDDRINFTDLIVVPNTFNQEKFKAHKVYFLNTQKMRDGAKLVQGHDPERDRERYGEALLPPDGRTWTIWQTIQNTIEDPNLTLYLVLDEAHRGMKETKADEEEKATIVSRLINGHAGIPAVPVVWGISATVDRFDKAMERAQNRTILAKLHVDAARVQESGLLKDTIVLDIPAESGPYRTTLVRRAADKVRAMTREWAEYADSQPDSKIVYPLLILQVENNPNHAEIGEALDVIFDRWPEITPAAIANVFGEHRTKTFGQWEVPYIKPERVQESSSVRVLVAKDAISTGWDCPRAEVMVSFRTAKDPTMITQLLGRMVRTPLARRIPGNDRLNAVECILPHFDAKAVTAIAEKMMHGGGASDEETVPGRRVLFDAKDYVPNLALGWDADHPGKGESPTAQAVWDKFVQLPAQSIPPKGAKPVKRLTLLAHELATDDLLPDAGKVAHAELHKVLNAARERFSAELAVAADDVATMEGATLVADMRGKAKSFSQYVEEADIVAIEAAYRAAGRVFSPDLARTYAEHLATQNVSVSREDALLEAHETIAAMGLVPEIKTYLESEAERLTSAWFTTYRAAIKNLSHERKAEYHRIRQMSREPQPEDLEKPEKRTEPTKVREANGQEHPLPLRRDHLMADESGNFPANLNDWEVAVLDRETQQTGFVAWYRNPARSATGSLAISYEDGQSWKALRPDFLVFSRTPSGEITASIVDPHGHHLSDALPKLKGLATYAEKHGQHFARIDAITKIRDTFRVLDMTERTTREAVLNATDAKSLYEGVHGNDY
ncbi:DEAD/DEAH box helicase [Luteococcus sanguinis]|uniref:DEAD/DEAH box helicase n=1 Tax=Luteococcus sanguinis TaxID=174038 RepID=A0ABW1X3V4_9ACTN